MINLIPSQGHTALKHEYLLRVASVYGFLFSGVLIASTILMLPTYLLISSQLSGAMDESSRVEETKRAFDVAFEEIKVANTLMAQLRKKTNVLSGTTVIEEVVRVAGAGIAFSAFNVSTENELPSKVQVQGVAANRSALASFKNTLEASPLFLTALVPIADLARDTNLPFLITIELETGTTTSSL